MTDTDFVPSGSFPKMSVRASRTRFRKASTRCQARIRRPIEPWRPGSGAAGLSRRSGPWQVRICAAGTVFERRSKGDLMRLLSSLVFVVGLWAWTVPVSAESIVERVEERGVLYCGGVARPGLAEQNGQAGWHGLEIDICRAIAAAVLNSPNKVEFHAYATETDFVEGA